MMHAFEATGLFVPRIEHRRRMGRLFTVVCASMSAVGLLVLGVLIVRVLWEGASWVSLTFLTNFPSVLDPESAGIKSALWGSVWLIAITGLCAVPIGVASAVYLEEYAPRNLFSRFIQLNISNLAGVPSIVYGILGLTVFVRWFRFDRSVLAGGCTLAVLVLPVIIIASREALLAVPRSIRLAAYALGATRWQTVWSHVLPAALPGIMTGIILGVSRAMGEAAPLIMLGAMTYVPFVPKGPFDAFTSLPIQIYSWTDQPQPEFHHLAAAGILVLLGILLPMNAVAVAVRAYHQRRRLG